MQKQIFDENGRLYGEYIPDTAGFTIKTLNLPSSWEYIYQNKDILMKVDQFGPVYAQANPPTDIMLFKREAGQKFSNWIVWIKQEGQKAFNNFFRPVIDCEESGSQPNDLSITFLPQKAVYEFSYQGLKVKTEYAIPLKGKEIVMKLSVTNLGDTDTDLKLKPFLVPYCNEAQLAPWDKNEWYLRTGFGNEDDKGIFWTQLLNPSGDKTKRRTLVMLADKKNLEKAEVSLEKFVGNGSVYCPEYAVSGELRIDGNRENGYGEYCEDAQIYAYPPVYAMEYNWHLDAGETKELVQVLSMPSNEADGNMPKLSQVLAAGEWLEPDKYCQKINEVEAFYNELCSINKIKTPDELFNYYANYWLPVQMYWVASLDRGWPSGMRGTRDSANDFAAEVYYDLESCRDVICTMLSCQRTDGWFPRQYSAAGRKGKHDLRPYADGGVFFLELFYKYMVLSQDDAFIDLKLPWLDSDEESTVWEHVLKTINYYIADENIGEHGLCKIRGGDWLDPIANAGLEGRGESVTITCQTIIALGYMIELCQKYNRNTEYIDIFNMYITKFKENLCEHAINKKGYFNSVFNDNGIWVFSDCDYDGKERPYGTANWYAVASCAAPKDKLDSVFNIMNSLKSEFGYRIYYPPFSPEKPMEKIGRSTSGDVPEFMAENGNVYNHGSHGFLVRALAKAGMGNELYDVMKWMLPCYQEKHPTYKAMTAPYAVINCYQELPGFKHRGMLSFLSGTVAMCIRGIYEWMCGIDSVVDGIEISPCIPDAWDEISFSMRYKDKVLDVTISRSGEEALILNGKPITKSEPKFNKYNCYYAVSDKDLLEGNNKIDITL